jgi:hypothetical protein
MRSWERSKDEFTSERENFFWTPVGIVVYLPYHAEIISVKLFNKIRLPWVMHNELQIVKWTTLINSSVPNLERRESFLGPGGTDLAYSTTVTCVVTLRLQVLSALMQGSWGWQQRRISVRLGLGDLLVLTGTRYQCMGLIVSIATECSRWTSSASDEQCYVSIMMAWVASYLPIRTRSSGNTFVRPASQLEGACFN